PLGGLWREPFHDQGLLRVRRVRVFHPQRLLAVALIGDQPRLPEIAARVDLCCRKPDRSEVKRLEWIGDVEELLPASFFGATFKNSALLRKCAGTLVRYARHRDGGLDDTRRLDSAVAPSWPDWEGHIVQNQY